MTGSLLPRLCFIAGALLTAGACQAAAYRVPLMREAPQLDGRVEPDEWKLCAGFDGFAMGGELERRRVRAYVGATRSHLYFGFRSQLPDEGRLLAQIDLDTVKIVHDDSIEVWVDPTPGSEHGKVFQMLANAIGRQGYKMHARGNEREDPDWRGNWQAANGFHNGYWHCEVAVPIEEIAPGRAADQGSWGINVCRNWKQPWQFSSLGGGAYMPEDARFTFAEDEALVITHESRAEPFLGEIDMVLCLTNPARQTVTVQVEMCVKRDAMPGLRTSEALSVGPGEEKQVTLKAQDQATGRFELELSVTSGDGETVHYARSYRWERGEPWAWTTETKEVLPIDFQFAYYPYLNRMRVLADIRNLPDDAVVERLTCSVRSKGGTEAIKSVVFDQFENGQQALGFELPPLEGEHEVVLRAHGQNVPEGELVKEFERTVYEWERAGLGTSGKVYPPFTPMHVEGKRVSTVLREHTMNDLGLWDQVVAAGSAVLAAPMCLHAEVDGSPANLRSQPLRFSKTEDNQAVAEAGFEGDGLKAAVLCTWDYDGTMRVDMGVQPNPDHTLSALRLEIPLRSAQATHLHAMGDGIRNTLYERVPEGEGVVWTSEQVEVVDLPGNFCSYIFVGTAKRGLSWFAENDRGWCWDRETPNLDLARSGDTVTLRVHLVNEPIVITEPRTITFGLLAAPVKPRLGNWRYKWNRDNYTLLGTDINWFALGNCGAVYPAKKDLYLWEMLARGNREQLPTEDIEQVLEYGRKYWEPYGEDAVERYERHVRHNLRARYGKKMVLYYNRASYQLAEEFQTFQDEWCLTDYRTVGKGDSISEIKLVPTDSYIDHALHWYGTAFDIAGSVGVYWDNYYLRASYNTMMQDAYQGDRKRSQGDGSMIPATGLWGLRELAKRTFQYMNQRGMLPITMAHMTSTGILPVLSFCTVQYDWEWKYSRGDVQYRFPREYILLVSNGELAGTWPVLLRDHGDLAKDPWTQRTFAGVCIVHELTGWGLPEVWEPLLHPVYELLDREGLEVYRYWDERRQPVTANHEDLPTIVYSVKGQEAIFAVTSYSEEDLEAVISIDPRALGFEQGYRVTDVETDQEVPVNDDRLPLVIKKHDVREFRILPRGAGQ